MHVSAPFDRGDHRDADVGKILEDLDSVVVDLAPHVGVGNIAEGREIDPGDELSSRSRQNHDLVVAILRNAIEGVDEVGVVLRRESQRAALRMEFNYQNPLRITRELQTAVRCKISRLFRLHGNPPDYKKVLAASCARAYGQSSKGQSRN